MGTPTNMLHHIVHKQIYHTFFVLKIPRVLPSFAVNLITLMGTPTNIQHNNVHKQSYRFSLVNTTLSL